MVKRTSLSEADCPVARSLDIIGDWWSLLIVRDAIDGVRRFSEFQKGLGGAAARSRYAWDSNDGAGCRWQRL
jgi:DNA-binding HxlR family transcriptional regulator